MTRYSMSSLTQGNIKIVTARYCDEADVGLGYDVGICEKSAGLFIMDNLKGHTYGRLKYRETEVIVYIPYIKYKNKVFLYKQKPVCKITEDNINIAIMAELIYIASNEELQTIKAWIEKWGDKSKSKYII